MPLTWSDICKVIFAIILPPIGVLLERGIGADLCINILLTILGYIPGKQQINQLQINKFVVCRNDSRAIYHCQILNKVL